jgi:hypothetical protein
MTPVVSWVVQNDFAEFMRSALQTLKAAAEEEVKGER